MHVRVVKSRQHQLAGGINNFGLRTATRIGLVKMKGGKYNMSEKVHTREFCISDYDAALLLWQRVEGLEIAEGDDRQGVAQFLARNPALSRVAIDGSAIVGVALCGNDG